MSDKPKVQDLLCESEAAQGYPKLRLLAGQVLQPGPWEHFFGWHDGLGPSPYCAKCKGHCDMPYPTQIEHRGICPIPDPDSRPLAVIAEELVKLYAIPNLEGLKLWSAIARFYSHKEDGRTWGHSSEDLMWYIVWATPAERIACCLVAMGEAGERG